MQNLWNVVCGGEDDERLTLPYHDPLDPMDRSTHKVINSIEIHGYLQVFVICKILFARCCLFVVCVYVQDCHKGNVAVKDGKKAILVVTYYVCTGWVS